MLSVELHGFCDASNVAYAAMIYLRFVANKETYVNVYRTKSKVVHQRKS